MTRRDYLQVHPSDDMIVALHDLSAGTDIELGADPIRLTAPVAAKHKFATKEFRAGEMLRMYGIVVGRAVHDIQRGEPVTTRNLVHATEPADQQQRRDVWQPPDVSRWSDTRFQGYYRPDGRVGTRNFWIVVPLVFCENRNLQVLQDALVEELGYGRDRRYQTQTRRLIELYQTGQDASEILETSLELEARQSPGQRVFDNVDGIKFLRHQSGCGESYHDSIALCGLLAGYINHPNVAGATVLSLGCQKAQIEALEAEIHKRNSDFQKPLYIFEQQQLGTESTLVSEAIKHTFAGLIAANQSRRETAPLSQICLGVECGGSDGFSGISANPAIGHCSDLVVTLGGSVILSEFPELAGCEPELAGRCVSDQVADRFLQLMKAYEEHVIAQGDGFDKNPSPGNIRDGLITDAMKSAGAARKGGSSPVVDALDYPEPVRHQGLNLLCTPGGDVESTTAMAGSGANVMFFSTGLGTPTGNAVCPVLKISSNSTTAQRMPDIIDVDAGGVVEGTSTVELVGEQLLDAVIATANGSQSKAEQLGQDDFIPWKRNLTF